MAAEVRLPLAHPNDEAAEVVRWLVADGEWVEAGSDVVEVESSKAVATVPAGSSGYLRWHVPAEVPVPAGTVLARLHGTAEELAADPGAAADTGHPPASADSQLAVRFSVSGREALARHGLSADLFRGQGLVTAQVVAQRAAELAGRSDDAGPEVAVPVERHRIGPAKQTEIARLARGDRALTSALTVRFDSVGLRASLRELPGTQPLVLAVLIHELARLLRQFPDLNARFADHHVERYTRVHVGVAVDLGQGLRVPVIRDADRRDPVEITIAYLDAMAAYHDRRLSATDLSGATVTVSDLSGDGILQFQPLLNQDQALAVGVGGDGDLPGHPMTVTAVFDHRVTTGRTVAGLLAGLKGQLWGEGAR